MICLNSCYNDKYAELHPNVPGSCDSAKSTYSGQVAIIISSYCLNCHSGAAASSSGGGYILENYNDVKNIGPVLLKNALYGTGVLNQMPKGSHIDSCTLGTIIHWVNAGMPNN